MVRVSRSASNTATAWRVRDALASHPLLGGANAHISVIASLEAVTLEGWTADDDVERLAVRLAQRAAGSRPVYVRLASRRRLAV